jgi:hypothetical protein
MAVARVRDAREEGELSPMRLEVFEVPRALVAEARCFREKVRGVEAEIASDEQQPFRSGAVRRICAAWKHGFERGEREANGTRAEDVAAGDGVSEVDLGEVHLWRKGRD